MPIREAEAAIHAAVDFTRTHPHAPAIDVLDLVMKTCIGQTLDFAHPSGSLGAQELNGWCTREDLPIINSRTTKVLQFFGSDVRQF